MLSGVSGEGRDDVLNALAAVVAARAAEGDIAEDPYADLEAAP